MRKGKRKRKKKKKVQMGHVVANESRARHTSHAAFFCRINEL